MTITLQTQRLTLRKPVPADWEAFRAFAMSDRAQTLGGPHSLGRAWRIFASELGHWEICGYGMWAVTKTGGDTAIGLIGPWTPADWPDTEIGWMMFGSAEGKGLAYEAAAAAIKDARERLGWTRIVSYIAADNTRSINLATRLGAVVDHTAKQPDPAQPCLVYLHPQKEAA